MEATTRQAVRAEVTRLHQAVAVLVQAAVTAEVLTQAVRRIVQVLLTQVHRIRAVHHHTQVQEGDKS